jgi:hypothetical protein
MKRLKDILRGSFIGATAASLIACSTPPNGTDASPMCPSSCTCSDGRSGVPLCTTDGAYQCRCEGLPFDGGPQPSCGGVCQTTGSPGFPCPNGYAWDGRQPASNPCGTSGVGMYCCVPSDAGAPSDASDAAIGCPPGTTCTTASDCDRICGVPQFGGWDCGSDQMCHFQG